MLFYEMRKNCFRKYVFVLLFALSLLDIGKIAVDKYQGRIDEVDTEYDGGKKAFEQIYGKLKGRINEEKLLFFDSEETRLGEIYDKRENYQDSNEMTYSGNLFEDYRILRKYIKEDFIYQNNYRDYSDELEVLAKENIEYYKRRGNEVKVKENEYIARTYSNRTISEFYRTDSINSYLNYSFSSVLILVMCFLGGAGVFGGEYDCEMVHILSTSKNGGIKSTMAKCLAAVSYSVAVVLWFSILDFVAYQILCNLEGLNNPIWMVKEFKNSFLNCRISDFILQKIYLRILAALSITLILLIVSMLFKKVIRVALVFFILILGWYTTGSYIFSISGHQNLLALGNPLVLLNCTKLFQGFYCIEINDGFLLLSTVCVWGNLLLALMALLIIIIGMRRVEQCRC